MFVKNYETTRGLLTNLAFCLLSISLLSVGAPAQNAVFKVQKTPSPNVHGNTLNAVAAVAATDAWAVGSQNDNNLNDSRTLIVPTPARRSNARTATPATF
jgi:hypothetical protein